MKLVKSLLLGSAAAIAAAAGAQAADLPSRKSAPVKYVQICDAYGAGFFYIPGTDICIHIGDIVVARFAYSPGGNFLAANPPAAGELTAPPTRVAPTFANSKQINTYSTDIDDIFSVDARDQTPWGTVRLFALEEFYDFGGRYNYSASGPGNSGGTGNYIFAVTNIIQWNGFTVGRAPSEFGFYKEANAFGGVLMEANTYSDLLAYTATFGGGFSATLSVENPQVFAQDGIGGTALSSGHRYVDATYGGDSIPTFVGNLRIDQGWGALQLSGGVQQINTVATTGPSYLFSSVGGVSTPSSTTPSAYDNQVGYGVMGGAEFNLPQIAAGDQLWLEAAYADGALQFLGVSGTEGNLSNDGNSGTPLLNGFQRDDKDAYAVLTSTGYTLQKSSGFQLMGDFLHYWSPQWRSNIYANWIGIDPGSASEHTPWYDGGLSYGSEYRIGGNIIFSPVAGFDIGVDVMYAKLNQTLNGCKSYVSASACTGYPIDAAPGGVLTTLHIQRAF